MTRDELISELERLMPSRKARAIYLRQDDTKLAASVERMRKVLEAKKMAWSRSFDRYWASSRR